MLFVKAKEPNLLLNWSGPLVVLVKASFDSVAEIVYMMKTPVSKDCPVQNAWFCCWKGTQFADFWVTLAVAGVELDGKCGENDSSG